MRKVVKELSVASGQYDPRSILAAFFFSKGEGKLETSHTSMLQKLLFDIFSHDATSFHPLFRSTYQNNRDHGQSHQAWSLEDRKILLTRLTTGKQLPSCVYFRVDSGRIGRAGAT